MLDTLAPIRSSPWVTCERSVPAVTERDAVDHRAHAPGSSVILVIERTVGSIDTGGKVGKLINRSHGHVESLPTAR